MIRIRPEKTTGFTLIELLVVIGIMVILIGLLVPATRSLTRANRVQTCSIRLQQIGVALKAYHLDYKAVPPVYILETGSGWDDELTDPTDPGDEIDNASTEPANNGLHILFETEYLHNRQALHCPLDKAYSDPNEAEYYAAYATLDEAAKYDYEINLYKYMPCRTWELWTDDSSRNPRQLAPSVEPVWIYDEVIDDYRWAWAPVAVIDNQSVGWYPDDTTVVTWCSLHVKEFVREGEGMYQVLFWDGSAKVIPARLLTDETDASGDPLLPDAAWKVHPDDTLPD